MWGRKVAREELEATERATYWALTGADSVMLSLHGGV